MTLYEKHAASNILELGDGLGNRVSRHVSTVTLDRLVHQEKIHRDLAAGLKIRCCTRIDADHEQILECQDDWIILRQGLGRGAAAPKLDVLINCLDQNLILKALSSEWRHHEQNELDQQLLVLFLRCRGEILEEGIRI